MGDTITLELTVTEALSALPVVTIAGQLADTVTGSGLSFSATRTVVGEDVSGAAGHVASFVDLAGNSGVASGDTTDGSAVVISTGTSVDSTAPQLISVSIASDNSNPAMATVGNTISIVSTASEPLEAATVTIAGRAAEVSWVGDGGAGVGTGFTATIVTRDSDTQGDASFVITYSDVSSNDGLLVVATTDGSLVTVDSGAPSLLAVSLSSDNS